MKAAIGMEILKTKGPQDLAGGGGDDGRSAIMGGLGYF